jgi:hypothetical protein
MPRCITPEASFLAKADDSPVTVGSGELLSRKEAGSPPATARRSKFCGLGNAFWDDPTAVTYRND